MSAAQDETIPIFPTPVMVCRKVLPPALVSAMIAQYEDSERDANVRTSLLHHTPTASPSSHKNYGEALRLAGPRIVAFGETLLGEKLNWGVKEIWINRMEPGGAQKNHNHANSFISGVIYLTETGQGSSTVFHRAAAADTFVMSNENKNTRLTAFTAPVFQAPAMEPGDMILFPSYLMHEVPPNQGAARYTAAFNALPHRIDSWGYMVSFK